MQPIEQRFTSDGKDVVLFRSGYNPLSTFNYGPFEYNTNRYSHLEQFYQVQKAKFFGDVESVINILKCRSPRKCKELGKNIKCYVPDKWGALAEEIIYQGARERFMKNALSRNYLMDTGDAVIGEATKYDYFWAIGLEIDDPMVRKKSAWPGQNVYGRILMKVRASIRE